MVTPSSARLGSELDILKPTAKRKLKPTPKKTPAPGAPRPSAAPSLSLLPEHQEEEQSESLTRDAELHVAKRRKIESPLSDSGTANRIPPWRSGKLQTPQVSKGEAFVIKEFEQLIEMHGPVVCISTLCGKFIKQHETSVTSIIDTRPVEVFKKYPSVFLVIGGGNVTLKKYEHLPEVCDLMGGAKSSRSKAERVARAFEHAQLPVPENITEEDVVDEFRRLILSDKQESVYISSLCGRFHQRFKTAVSAIIDCKPAEFLRRYPDIFVMTGGGNVGLREVLGPDAVSVPPPRPREATSDEEEKMLSSEELWKIVDN